MQVAPYLALVLALAAACQLLAYRAKVPSILLLLVVGFGLGQVVTPEEVLGRDVLFAGVSVSVGIILFEGSLSLRFRDLRGLGTAVVRLCTVVVALAWVLITASGMVAGIGWQLSLLIGALLVVTGPTVIAPIVRQLRPTRRVSSMLRWEGIVVDPIGAVLAVLVFQTVIISGPEVSIGPALVMLGRLLLICTALTLVFGVGLEVAMRRHWIPDFLEGVVFLAVAVGALVVSNQLQAESGLLTVTMLGIYLANRPGLRLDHVREFKEHLQVLIVGALFVMLAGRISPAEVVAVAPIALVFVTLLILVVRPASVWLGLLGTSATREERTLLSFMAPRGIVAAAVTSIFALELEHAAENAVLESRQIDLPPLEALELEANAERLTALVAEASDLVPLVFVTIVVTVAVYGLGVGRLAERLGLATTTPNGILFAGAPVWARQAAGILQGLGVPTLLVSLSPAEVSQARMAGLRVERTHILSEYAVEDMELAGIGSFVAATYDDATNSTAAREFAHTLGSSQTFQLRRQDERRDEEAEEQGSGSRRRSSPESGATATQAKQRTARKLTARLAFRPALSAPELEQRVREGMAVRQTKLTEQHTLDDFLERQPDAVLMFSVEDGHATVVGRTTTVPQSGVTLVALVRPRAEANGGR
ncbi:cation:proton antiporter [Ornithinimicrobium pekingense]|uniref:Sodium:hydrogen antiporter n=1 Tax=Ornithinimicrobium pekingense TaxID=384677 RepID=A0ABQ2F9M0_9MICO|nr:cation:proton antiporter [Ornithinimicrobium pekingense]GGK72097.1 sodium:hydrogen antiporter [Ornithinimicrobium pekingense]